MSDAKSTLVSLSQARRQRGHADAAPATSAGELEAIRELLDAGQSREAEARLNQLLKTPRADASLLGQARCLLSAALITRARYGEAHEAVLLYETPAARTPLDVATSLAVCVQLGITYNYTGDHPKAIALLSQTLRDATADGQHAHDPGATAQLGALYLSLARVYRRISEYPIARGHAQSALEHFRQAGDWRGMANAYLGIGLADNHEGEYEAGLENMSQAVKLIGDRPAPYMLGILYATMAGICWFLKRPQDGIRYLEKAIDYYERTEHKVSAAVGYNNLGINLMLVGDWARAQVVLERALALADEVDARGPTVSMILDSMGQLLLLRGNLLDAQRRLERAVEIARQHDNKWYTGQALRTLGHCHLAMGNAGRALDDAEQALVLAERIGDRQATCDSLLVLAEAHLQNAALSAAAAALQRIADHTTDSPADLAVAGAAQRLYGLAALAQHDATLAIHHFGRSVSICSILGDRYRIALAHYGLGCAYTGVQHERAADHFERALAAFRELGAQLDIARTEKAIVDLGDHEATTRQEFSAVSQLLTLRLAEAVASRELLLRELAAVLHQETGAARVLITELGEEGEAKVCAAHGYDAGGAEVADVAAELCAAKNEAEREAYAIAHDATVIMLRPTHAAPALVCLAPRHLSVLPGGAPLDPLLRVVELGMNVCTLRARVSATRGAQEQSDYSGAGLLPGFIHSSPAMTSLVEEVHKIRSSDVTVLVTGDSGTGKELVSRAIHALSARRSKVFVPFNCTAVPKELSDAYLFGYRRGSFTGAVADSPGVIRAAAGGTLFLDEIGDLPHDVQPKLLRFLQEGEIQPLGEQRPIKVDVRVIAATNTDLEGMVADGRFREDLYYRLNVIRLRVPPLSERRSEIPTIVNYYVNHYSEKFGRRDIQITPQAIDLLMVCDWPGNVRQLCNEIQRIVARAEDGMVIKPDHLSPELKRIAANVVASGDGTSFHTDARLSALDFSTGQPLNLADAMGELERRMIAEAMRRHNNNISRAARELGLTRRGLYLKLDRHALNAASA